MENIVRSAYCNPPKHGCQIVLRILQSSEHFQEWIENVSTMAKRVKRVRRELQERLESLETPGNWNHITQQIGMFSYTGLTSKQVEHMVKKYHIYMLESGRINMCGIGSKNIDYVARAIHESVVLSPQDTNKTLDYQCKFTVRLLTCRAFAGCKCQSGLLHASWMPDQYKVKYRRTRVLQMPANLSHRNLMRDAHASYCACIKLRSQQ
uniref:aspartate transaminase n=1 Tax=Timema genevievae TaxID=629358 RepID=A0A7R9K0V1_TIMGE|nr:unnamed protein product [Timema genevievae]